MLKRILVIFLALSLVSAVSLEKSIEGSQVLSESDSIKVSLSLESEKSLKLLTLKDNIPEHFTAKNYPSSCSVEDSQLVCNYDIQIDTFSISYDLVATSTGKNILVSDATLRYINPDTDVEESVVSNDIPKPFFIGLPKITLNLTNFQLDGRQKETVLPNSAASVVLQVKNEGSIDAENITITVTSPLFSDTQVMDVLRPDASTSFKLTARSPSISNFEEKSGTITVSATWTDMGDRSYQPAVTTKKFEFVRPKLFVTRDTEVKWKKDEVLKPYILINIEMENEGNAAAQANILQQLPDLPELAVPTKGFIEDGIWKLSETIEAGETKTISIMIPAKRGIIDIPPLNIDYVDGRNNIYERIEVKTEEVAVDKTIWAIIYGAIVEPLGNRALLEAGIILAATLALLTKVRNPPMMLALGAVAVLCSLIIYTWYVV